MKWAVLDKLLDPNVIIKLICLPKKPKWSTPIIAKTAIIHNILKILDNKLEYKIDNIEIP